jgi:2'-5' RNA ligase
MTERLWRCFWAVELPEDLRAALADGLAELRRDASIDAAWRWTEPLSWHLTVAFLGGVSADAVPGIQRAVADAVRELEPFTATAGGLGGFPSGQRARVLWYGVQDPERRLRSLARAVGDACGLEDSGPFRPHVTLARARDRLGTDLTPVSTDLLPAGSVDVTGVTLLRSHLGQGPARYERLGVAPLAATLAMSAP